MGVHQIDHPLVQHKLGFLRDKRTETPLFRRLVSEIASLMAFEAFSDLEVQSTTVPTWAGHATVHRLREENVVLCPILRAGLGMLEGVHAVLPSASVSAIGLERDEDTLEPRTYYEKHPPSIQGASTVILDPMLATGGSAVAAARLLRDAGATELRGLFLLAAPEGIARLQDADPELEIYTAAVDERLDANGYILPGLGDAGDRIFGT